MTTLQWIILLVSLVVLVGIIFLARKRKVILVLLLLAVAGVGWYAYKEYSRTNRDLASASPDFKVEAGSLVKEFEINDSTANKKYLGKIIEIEGPVNEISKDESGYYTLVLGDTATLSSVRCSMDTVHSADAASLKAGSSVILRGACTGFNKDEMGLGSDLILNRCVIISTKK